MAKKGARFSATPGALGTEIRDFNIKYIRQPNQSGTKPTRVAEMGAEKVATPTPPCAKTRHTNSPRRRPEPSRSWQGEVGKKSREGGSTRDTEVGREREGEG